MIFEKEFPSISPNTVCGLFMKEDVATREQIQKYCLDKQRVKEILEGYDIEGGDSRIALYKELGL